MSGDVINAVIQLYVYICNDIKCFFINAVMVCRIKLYLSVAFYSIFQFRVI